MKYCFNCGSEIIGTNPKFCSECGIELIKSVESHRTVENQPKFEIDYENPREVFKPKFKISYHFLMSVFGSSSLFFMFFFFMFGTGIIKDLTENLQPEYTVNYLPNWIHGQYVYYITYLFSLFCSWASFHYLAYFSNGCLIEKRGIGFIQIESNTERAS